MANLTYQEIYKHFTGNDTHALEFKFAHVIEPEKNPALEDALSKVEIADVTKETDLKEFKQTVTFTLESGKGGSLQEIACPSCNKKIPLKLFQNEYLVFDSDMISQDEVLKKIVSSQKTGAKVLATAITMLLIIFSVIYLIFVNGWRGLILLALSIGLNFILTAVFKYFRTKSFTSPGQRYIGLLPLDVFNKPEWAKELKPLQSRLGLGTYRSLSSAGLDHGQQHVFIDCDKAHKLEHGDRYGPPYFYSMHFDRDFPVVEGLKVVEIL